MPRVSILIPTFNRQDMLREAVESALAQTYPDLEVVVSDNASTDGTRETMAAYAGNARFRYHCNPENLGMVGNWRQAVRDLATGDWFLILSDDDAFLDPDFVTKAMALAERRPDLGLVYGEGILLDTCTGERKALRLPFGDVAEGAAVFASRDMVRPQDFILCSVLFRRDLALSLDPFDNPLNLCCDSELFLKLCLLAPVGVLHGDAALYRIHGANLILRPHPDLPTAVANLEHYLRPWRLAQELGVLTSVQSVTFRRTAVRALQRAILKVVAKDWKDLRPFLTLLREASPDLAAATLRTGRLYRKLAVRLLAQPWR